VLSPLIDKLTRGEHLTSEEASVAMTEIMEGRASDAEMAGLLIGLATKGEQPHEILGLAQTMRAHAVPLSRAYDDVFDCCGTGGDRSGTFNISSCAAIVVAACGVRVAKHGNRSISSACGSADVFEAMGVRITAPPAQNRWTRTPSASADCSGCGWRAPASTWTWWPSAANARA